jgi:hypothetical protein
MPSVLTPAPSGGETITPGGGAGEVKTGGGRRSRGASVKQMKRMLKKAGLKTTGRKAALTRRAKKAHLKLRGGMVFGGGEDEEVADGGRRRRRSRKSRGFKLF